jgi:hypothetical protein
MSEDLPSDYYEVSDSNSEDSSEEERQYTLHILVPDIIRQDRPRLDDHPMDVDWKLYEDNLPLILLKVHQRREDDAAIVDLCVHVPPVESRYVDRQLAAIRAGSIDDDLSDDEMPLDQAAANLTEKRRAQGEYRRFLELFWSCRNSLGEAFGFLSRGEDYLCAPFGASGVGSVTGDKHPF